VEDSDQDRADPEQPNPERPFTFRAYDGATGEITEEVPLSEADYAAFLDDIEGWKQAAEDGRPWSAP
jgi:hypothetical protein